ncbi:MAG: hypothetical protein LQ341_007503, partial [Variospora aurantia]
QSAGNARRTMYRVAINIYLTLIDDDTGSYAIKIEGHIRSELHSLFRAAAISIASRCPSKSQSPNFQVTPWDEAPDPFTNPANDNSLRSPTRHSIDKGSSMKHLTCYYWHNKGNCTSPTPGGGTGVPCFRFPQTSPTPGGGKGASGFRFPQRSPTPGGGTGATGFRFPQKSPTFGGVCLEYGSYGRLDILLGLGVPSTPPPATVGELQA